MKRDPYIPDVGHLFGYRSIRGKAVSKLVAGRSWSSRRIIGVALADQVKSMDWNARRADFAQEVPLPTLRDVRTLIAKLLDLR